MRLLEACVVSSLDLKQMKINYLIGAIITLPFAPPISLLLFALFVLALISGKQFEERVIIMEAATTPIEQTVAAVNVAGNGCIWIVVSFGGAFVLMMVE